MVMTSADLGTLTATTLVHSCLIGKRQQERDGDDAPAFDAYEQPIVGEYVPAVTRTPCFARYRPGSDEVQEPGRAFVPAHWQVRLPRGTVVTTDDEITDVKDEAGTAIVAGPLGVDEVIPRAGHVLAVSYSVGLSGPASVEAP